MRPVVLLLLGAATLACASPSPVERHLPLAQVSRTHNCVNVPAIPPDSAVVELRITLLPMNSAPPLDAMITVRNRLDSMVMHFRNVDRVPVLFRSDSGAFRIQVEQPPYRAMRADVRLPGGCATSLDFRLEVQD